jgi:4-hydroxybenzoate polyprenyltransferase
MSVPMAFAAQQNNVPLLAWGLYVATVLWTVAYDTMYAMVDRNDDIKIGVKSSAILFAQMDKLVIALLQISTLSLLCYIGYFLRFSYPYYIGLFFAILLVIYQHILIYERKREKCFQAFLNNHWFGLVIFLGIVAHYKLVSI